MVGTGHQTGKPNPTNSDDYQLEPTDSQENSGGPGLGDRGLPTAGTELSHKLEAPGGSANHRTTDEKTGWRVPGKGTSAWAKFDAFDVPVWLALPRAETGW